MINAFQKLKHKSASADLGKYSNLLNFNQIKEK